MTIRKPKRLVLFYTEISWHEVKWQKRVVDVNFKLNVGLWTAQMESYLTVLASLSFSLQIWDMPIR